MVNHHSAHCRTLSIQLSELDAVAEQVENVSSLLRQTLADAEAMRAIIDNEERDTTRATTSRVDSEEKQEEEREERREGEDEEGGEEVEEVEKKAREEQVVLATPSPKQRSVISKNTPFHELVRHFQATTVW
eukprot:CAMPEP_0113883918 /NCGR_PEP_ID=MMETSP0780_2-20120614/9907_1 /TAXON_ID=652834 /ORGANISM="Palpitomonas bilix" /LENGTH=131 /DNA_ID=CAMNT_0000871357 /DNA_START=205 /DNA_END=597 /DNA_ORIENTATION=- /assembly_acc=CAM_ASM_000599